MTANSCAGALAAMKQNSVGDNPYEFWTDKDVEGNFTISQPVSFRSYLGGTAGSILDVYGTGEYEWDKYLVKFHTHRGSDSGVTIRYGKNLTDVKKVTDSSGIWTGIVPFWHGLDENESETLITLPEKVVYADTAEDYAYKMVIPVDFSGSFQSVPTEAQLRETAGAYVRNNATSAIPSSIDVSFVNLWQTEEYKNVAPLQRLRLCDTVTIHHRTLGVENKAKIVSVTYDVLRAEAAIFCQRDKAKVHMGSCLVHMHHCGQDRLRILPFFYKVACGPEEFPDLFTAFSFEEFRCRRDQNLYHADTVLPDPAPGFRHLPADLLIVSASRGYQVEVHI